MKGSFFLAGVQTKQKIFFETLIGSTKELGGPPLEFFVVGYNNLVLELILLVEFKSSW